MKLTSNNAHHHHHHDFLLRSWVVGCALLIGACGTEAMGAPGVQGEADGDGNLPAEVDAIDGASHNAVDTTSGSDYIYVGNFAGEPPAHDLFSEPGHAFIFGFVPDGKYVFQVTDAQCTELLAGPGAPGEIPNTEGRVISASGGRFEAYPAAPFLTAQYDTSGAYVVHVTPVEELGMPSEGCYGFKPESSFTAEFAIVPGPKTDPSYCVSGGVFAAGEGMEGIEVVVFQSTQQGPIAQAYSRADGMYEICGLRPGEDYQVSQRVPAGYTAVAPADGTVNVSNFTRENLVIQPFENQAL
jgi:hypothetical protein